MSTTNPTNAADYTLQQNNVAGFAEAFILEGLGLLSCGLVAVDTNPVTFGKGNVWQKRGRIRDLTALQTPVAATETDINDLSTWAENGVIARRLQAYGVENMAQIAAGDMEAQAAHAQLLEHNLRYGIAKIYHDKLLVSMFTAGTGALIDTHFVDTSGAVFESVRIQQALRKWGEYGTSADGILMHSYVRSKLYETGLVSDAPADLLREMETTGVRYGGKIGGLDIFVDDLCYSSNPGGAGVYNSYVFKRGALTLGYSGQLLNVEYYREPRLAGGTDVVQGWMSFGPHVNGVTTTLTPTVSGGATDAEILLSTNWTQRTGITAPEIGIVCIQSTEV